MKTTLYVLITMAILMFITPVISNPAKWSRFIKSKSQDEVTISFRQKQNNQGWSIEWQVKNNSDSSVEPILLSRQYFCKNGMIF